jgi:hypothetical protein
MSWFCVSISANFFPQHCIKPTFTPVTHVQGLSEELQQKLAKMRCENLTLAALKTLTGHADAYIAGTLPPNPEQPLEQRMQHNVAPQTLSAGL